VQLAPWTVVLGEPEPVCGCIVRASRGESGEHCMAGLPAECTRVCAAPPRNYRLNSSFRAETIKVFKLGGRVISTGIRGAWSEASDSRLQTLCYPITPSQRGSCSSLVVEAVSFALPEGRGSSQRHEKPRTLGGCRIGCTTTSLFVFGVHHTLPPASMILVHPSV